MAYVNNKMDNYKQLKILVIRPGETVDAFNLRFLHLYYSLNSELKKQISVYDYMNAVRTRYELHHALTMREPASIEEACQMAKNHEYWQEYNAMTYGTMSGPVEPFSPFYTQSGYNCNYTANYARPPTTKEPFYRNNPYYRNNYSSTSMNPAFATPGPNPEFGYQNHMRNTGNRYGNSGFYPGVVMQHPGNKSTKVCFNCGQPGHIQRDCGRLNH